MAKHLGTITDFAARLDSLHEKADIWRAFSTLVSDYGFQYAVNWDVPGPGERLQDNIVCGTFHPTWHAHYWDNNYVLRDPLSLHLSRTTLPFSLEDALACPDYTPEQRRVREEAREFGLHSVFFIPMRSPRNGPSVITLLGNTSLQLQPDERAELHLAAICADARLRPMLPQHDPSLPALTDRERECLQWVAAGKSDHDIGDILHISDKTVNFHIESVKRKYLVSSRTLAASMAVRAGVVHI